MNRICWWLVEVLSRVLDPCERDAVRGDLAECGDASGEALREVLGLVIRRQAGLWSTWQPWLLLVGLIFPLGMLLSVASRHTAGVGATYTWLYANNWDFALLRNRGFWYVFAESAEFVTKNFLTLACWSWSAGFMLGCMARKNNVRSNAVLLCAMLLFGVIVGAPRYMAFFFDHVHRTFAIPMPKSYGPVCAQMFYRIIFPLIVQGILVALPAVWGLYAGTVLDQFPLLLRRILLAAAIASLAVLAIEEPGIGFVLRAYKHSEIWRSWPIKILSVAVYWPIPYLALRSVGSHWQKRKITFA